MDRRLDSHLSLYRNESLVSMDEAEASSMQLDSIILVCFCMLQKAIQTKLTVYCHRPVPASDSDTKIRVQSSTEFMLCQQ